MKKPTWDEKVIEAQLKKLPKIEDKQSKEILFTRIQQKVHEDNIKINKKKSWFVPSLATAAVLLLMLLIVPSFLNDTAKEEAREFKQESEVMDMNPEDAAGIASIEEVDDKYRMGNVEEFVYFSSIYETATNDFVTIAVPAYTDNGDIVVVPISIKSEGNNDLENFVSMKDAFPFELYGLMKFPELQINFIMEGKAGTVIIDIPKSSLESLASAESLAYSLALQETFSLLGFKKIEFSSDGEPGVIWGQHGPIYEMDLSQSNYGYYLYKSHMGYMFLARDVSGASYDEKSERSFRETLEKMKLGSTSVGFETTIPPNLEFLEITSASEQVTITLNDDGFIEDRIEYLVMMDAILFTAKEFGYRYVKFEGINIDKIGPYSLQERIEVPSHMNAIY